MRKQGSSIAATLVLGCAMLPPMVLAQAPAAPQPAPIAGGASAQPPMGRDAVVPPIKRVLPKTPPQVEAPPKSAPVKSCAAGSALDSKVGKCLPKQARAGRGGKKPR